MGLTTFTMPEPFKLLKEEWIHPLGVQGGTFRLAPVDVNYRNSRIFMSWPFFFDYDLDATRLKEALEKLSVKYPILCGRAVPDADTRYSIKVRNPNARRRRLMHRLFRAGQSRGPPGVWLSFLRVASGHDHRVSHPDPREGHGLSCQFPCTPRYAFLHGSC